MAYHDPFPTSAERLHTLEHIATAAMTALEKNLSIKDVLKDEKVKSWWDYRIKELARIAKVEEKERLRKVKEQEQLRQYNEALSKLSDEEKQAFNLKPMSTKK